MVRDETGGALPGVTVTVRSGATGAVRTVTTDSSGRYRVAALDPGEYEVRGELDPMLDIFNLFNRVNVKDINTVWGGIDYPNTPPPAQLGFGSPRDVFNPRQVQFAAKLKF